MEKHIETLREYTELDKTWFDSRHWDVHPAWSTLVHLRSLRMGRFAQTDMESLTSLVVLEELQLVVDEAARQCRPLRHLTRLRELQIANGWVCDLVGYLPRLETLVCEAHALALSYNYSRMVFCQREWPDCRDGNDEASVRRYANGDGVGVATRLRKLVLRGCFTIDSSECPSVQAMLEHVEHLEVHSNIHGIRFILEEIANLRHLKRLAFRDIILPVVGPASQRRFSFASAESLEELYYGPRRPRPFTDVDVPPKASFPLWFHDRLPNLRVLASPCQESLAQFARLCPRLTHLHIPYSRECGFPEASRESLRRLCVVTLGISYDCTWLRNECGPEGALPLLRRIFHPTTDCLSSSPCARHRLALSKEGDWFISGRVFVPSWSQHWETIRYYGEDERRYHRVLPTSDLDAEC